jgi:uncharacterized protein (DUF1778 family)
MAVTESQELARLTINLTPRAAAALTLAANITGENRTDTVNRALQFYAYAEQVISAGGTVLVREPGTDELTVVKFM